jgi:hypothetical protein
MKPSRTATRWAVGLAVLVIAGCGDGSGSNGTCIAGARQACVGTDGCAGERVCWGSPASWTDCSCPLPDGGPADGRVADGSSGDGGGAALGASCTRDADCPTGGFCLTGDTRQLFGGAPPAGTCVAACDSVGGCAAFGSATCVQVDDPAAAADAGQSATGLCFERCQIGGAAGTGAKCHGRAQIACAPVEASASGAGYCRPICATSGECLSGVCDPRRGVCVDSAPTDPAFALRCQAPADGGAGPDGGGGAADAAVAAEDGGGDAAVAAPPCAGLCVGVSASSSLCTRRCLFGSTDECAPELDGRRRGGCLFVTKGGSVGDLGYCAELCDCNRDCADPSLVCDAFDDPTLEAAFTRKGVCTPAELVINRALSCTN